MAYVNNVETESIALRKKNTTKTQQQIRYKRTMQAIKTLENLRFYFTTELSTQTKSKLFLKFRY